MQCQYPAPNRVYRLALANGHSTMARRVALIDGDNALEYFEADNGLLIHPSEALEVQALCQPSDHPKGWGPYITV